MEDKLFNLPPNLPSWGGAQLTEEFGTASERPANKDGGSPGRTGRKEEPRITEEPFGKSNEDKIIRLLKPVIFSDSVARNLDMNVIAPHYYGSFNYSLMPEGSSDFKLSLGVTSANPSEGKTLVACNLAVSLALTHQKETVLIDLNTKAPRVHEVFGIPAQPGIVDALHGEAIYTTRTAIKGLSVVCAGEVKGSGLEAQRLSTGPRAGSSGGTRPVLRLEMVSFFRDVVYSLQEIFPYVVVDLPSMNTASAPIVFANQLDGIFVVVDVGKTKLGDVEKMFRRLNQRQVQGFIFNRTTEDRQ